MAIWCGSAWLPGNEKTMLIFSGKEQNIISPNAQFVSLSVSVEKRPCFVETHSAHPLTPPLFTPDTKLWHTTHPLIQL